MSKFQTGDVVKYINPQNTVWKVGETHIIYEISYIGKNTFEYSTNRGAWFNESDFKLIRKADKKSFAQLDKDLEEEEDEEYE